MRRIEATAVAAAAALLLAAGSAATARPRLDLVRAVVDGDTIVLADGRRVRLVQIDSPELGQGECYSRQARAALLSLLPPGRARVRLELDPRLDRTDRYGRTLAYVFKGRENVNRTRRIVGLPVRNRCGCSQGTSECQGRDASHGWPPFALVRARRHPRCRAPARDGRCR